MEFGDLQQNIKRCDENWMGLKRLCFAIVNCCKLDTTTPP
jgi:hypothetical protein